MWDGKRDVVGYEGMDESFDGCIWSFRHGWTVSRVLGRCTSFEFGDRVSWKVGMEGGGEGMREEALRDKFRRELWILTWMWEWYVIWRADGSC